MNAEKIKSALQKMPETGVSGFEGLAKRFLELSLDERFVLARGGDQLSGDAHNLERNVCLQAKRYTDDSPQAKNIEGDFDESLRTLPNTDIFVLAVTRETAQLNDTLDAMRQKSAVDIIVWDFASESSALPVLCVEYWDRIQDFPAISAISPQLGNFINATRNSPLHRERLEKLQSALHDCSQTHSSVSEAARQYLSRRFQLSSAAEPLPLQSIRLAAALDRARYRKQAVDWWIASKNQVFVVKGAEGYGKTWIAAQDAKEISDRQETVVLWLDSIQWCDCTCVDDVLEQAISRAVIADKEKTQRLVRKLRNRWSRKTLVVLDGANERRALPAAQNILEDLFVRHPGKCRILFTTRQLELVPDYDASLWTRCHHCAVEPFDDNELRVALAQTLIPPEELNAELSRIARIPRYFAACLRLRASLRKFQNISVALVLWIDLLDKINGFEPAIRESLGFTQESDAVEILVKLATTLPDAISKGEAQNLLNSCFGGRYSEVKNYLREIRIMERTGVFEATLSREHTVLGRALFLQQILERVGEPGIRRTADLLLESLEPFSGEDGGAEALFVSLQLTAINDRSAETAATDVSRFRATLLFAWLFSHNSNASHERLAFWCEFDTNAYAQFVEAFFEQLYAGNAQEFVVTPLANMWRCGLASADALEPFLRRWLLLTWFDGCRGTRIDHQGHQIPIASTEDQVRLSSIVISFLSLRINLSFLPELALCVATESLSWKQIRDHRYEFKSVGENLGILMRWHYTERVLGELNKLVDANASNPLLIGGVRRLARMLTLAQLPGCLELSSSTSGRAIYFGTPAVCLIRQGHPVFSGERRDLFPNEKDFAYLAVRDDLPELCAQDVAAICSVVEQVSDMKTLHANRAGSFEDGRMDAVWPWYAKHCPHEFASVAGQMQLDALRREESHQIYPMFSFLSGVLPRLSDTDLAEWERLASAKASAIEVVNGRLESHVGLLITETALLLLPEVAFHRWIVAAAHDEGRRYSMCFRPISEILPLTLPVGSREFARQRCFEFEDSGFGANEAPPTEVEYWGYILGLVTETDPLLYEWAKRRLLQRGSGAQNYSLLRILLRSAPRGRLEADLFGPDPVLSVDQQALRIWGLSDRIGSDLVSSSYEELMKKMPQGFVGMVLALSNRKADLNRWGAELCGLALSQIGKPPFERRSRRETRLGLGKDGIIESVGCGSLPVQTTAWSSTAGSWGVDYADIGSQMLKSKSYEKDSEEEFDRWRLDEAELQKWENYELHTFGAWLALERWTEWFPEEFEPRARAILQAAIGEPRSKWHLGGLLHALVCCFLRFSPSAAWGYFASLNNGDIRVSVTSTYDVPEFFSRLWNKRECVLPAHDELRRTLFKSARNDLEIMVQCVAALAGDNENSLTRLAEELLADDLQRERALGVSILAWVGTEQSANRLKEINLSDPSKWVRRHAEWAREVTLQEKSARALLRKLTTEPDLYRLSAGLQVLKPALTPMALWWAPTIRRDLANPPLSPKHAAILESFWHHVERTHKSHVKVFRRDLEEFCRGEKLDQLKTAKLAPWWDIDCGKK